MSSPSNSKAPDLKNKLDGQVPSSLAVPAAPESKRSVKSTSRGLEINKEEY